MEKTINTYQMEEPFTIIEIVEEGKFKIAIANYIVSKKEFKTKENAENYVKSRPWELIFNTMALYTEFYTKNIKKLR